MEEACLLLLFCSGEQAGRLFLARQEKFFICLLFLRKDLIFLRKLSPFHLSFPWSDESHRSVLILVYYWSALTLI